MQKTSMNEKNNSVKHLIKWYVKYNPKISVVFLLSFAILKFLVVICFSVVPLLFVNSQSVLEMASNKSDYIFDLSLAIITTNVSVALIVFTREKSFFGKQIRKVIFADLSPFWFGVVFFHFLFYALGLLIFFFSYNDAPIVLLNSFFLGILTFFHFVYLIFRGDFHLIFNREEGVKHPLYYKNSICRKAFCASKRVLPDKEYSRGTYFFQNEMAYLVNHKEMIEDQKGNISCLADAVEQLGKYIRTSNDFECLYLFVNAIKSSELSKDYQRELFVACNNLFQCLTKRKIIQDIMWFSKIQITQELVSEYDSRLFWELYLEF